MKNFKLLACFAIAALLVVATWMTTIYESGDKSLSESPRDPQPADDLKQSDRRAASIKKSRLTANFDYQKRLKIIGELPPEKKSQYLMNLANDLIKELKRTGSYGPIAEVFQNLNESEVRTMLQFVIIGAESGKGLNYDLSAQEELIGEFINNDQRAHERLLKKFGKRRGGEKMDGDAYLELPLKKQFSLLLGMAQSGHAEGLISSLVSLNQTEHSQLLIDQTLSMVMKFSPEDTVELIDKMDGSTHKDKLLYGMVKALAKIGAEEDAMDWINEIEDGSVRSEASKLLNE